MKSLKRVCCFLSLPILALCIATPARAQETDVVQRAQELHDEGVRLFQEGQYRNAASSFAAAEELSSNPLNLYNQARCYQELGEYETALEWIDRYRSTPGLTAEDLAGANRLRQEIVATQRASNPPPEEPPQPQPQPQPPVESSPIAESIAAPWAVLGSGLGLLVVGGVLDIVALTRSDPAVEQFGSYTEYEDWRTSSRNIAIAGDVLVGVGAAMAVGGLIWLLVARSRRTAAQAASRYQLNFSVGQERVGLHVGIHL